MPNNYYERFKNLLPQYLFEPQPYFYDKVFFESGTDYGTWVSIIAEEAARSIFPEYAVENDPEEIALPEDRREMVATELTFLIKQQIDSRIQNNCSINFFEQLLKDMTRHLPTTLPTSGSYTIELLQLNLLIVHSFELDFNLLKSTETERGEDDAPLQVGKTTYSIPKGLMNRSEGFMFKNAMLYELFKKNQENKEQFSSLLVLDTALKVLIHLGLEDEEGWPVPHDSSAVQLLVNKTMLGNGALQPCKLDEISKKRKSKPVNLNSYQFPYQDLKAYFKDQPTAKQKNEPKYRQMKGVYENHKTEIEFHAPFWCFDIKGFKTKAVKTTLGTSSTKQTAHQSKMKKVIESVQKKKGGNESEETDEILITPVKRRRDVANSLDKVAEAMEDNEIATIIGFGMLTGKDDFDALLTKYDDSKFRLKERRKARKLEFNANNKITDITDET